MIPSTLLRVRLHALSVAVEQLAIHSPITKIVSALEDSGNGAALITNASAKVATTNPFCQQSKEEPQLTFKTVFLMLSQPVLKASTMMQTLRNASVTKSVKILPYVTARDKSTDSITLLLRSAFVEMQKSMLKISAMPNARTQL